MIQRNIHHAGKVPRRTAIGTPAFSRHANKWSAAFEMWATLDGGEHLMSSVTSGAFFDTAELALEAAGRAMDVLQATDRFPNMCEPF